MHVIRRIFVFLFFVFLFLSCASDHIEPFPDTLNSNKRVHELESEIRTLVNSSDSLSIKEIGLVKYKGFSWPISVVTYTGGNSECKILINAAIHGNEPAGAFAVIKIIETLVENESACSFDIIPVVNPWGFSQNIRYNKEGVDINRDFASDNSQETRIMKKFIKGKKYKLMIDLHEDPEANGFYIYQYGRSDKSISEKIVNEISKMGYPIEQDIKMIILKTDNGIIDAPMWGIWYMKFTGQMSIANYYRYNNSNEVFTIETPTKLPLEDRIKIQISAVDLLVNEIGG